jgi:hypothetical protein
VKAPAPHGWLQVIFSHENLSNKYKFFLLCAQNERVLVIFCDIRIVFFDNLNFSRKVKKKIVQVSSQRDKKMK